MTACRHRGARHTLVVLLSETSLYRRSVFWLLKSSILHSPGVTYGVPQGGGCIRVHAKIFWLSCLAAHRAERCVLSPAFKCAKVNSYAWTHMRTWVCVHLLCTCMHACTHKRTLLYEYEPSTPKLVSVWIYSRAHLSGSSLHCLQQTSLSLTAPPGADKYLKRTLSYGTVVNTRRHGHGLSLCAELLFYVAS